MKKFKPHSMPGGDHYARLFPPAERPDTVIDWARLIHAFVKLTDEMKDDGSRPDGLDLAIDAGYTYFGQFIDHDLTKDSTSLGGTLTIDSLEVRNEQSPRFDLSHLYGDGPFDPRSRSLYNKDDVTLLVGDPVPSVIAPHNPKRSFDLALDEKLRPRAADPRAGENIIIRQLTAVFARLHNAAVEQWRVQATSRSDLFRRARLQTTWQFQWLVVKDYVLTVLQPAVYRSLFERDETYFEWDQFTVPFEFSIAAMRFGHSMVRDGYVLSAPTGLKLPDLLREGLKPGPLRPELEIDWGRFFQGAGKEGPATTAQPIDTRISQGMYEIPMGVLRLFHLGLGEGVPYPLPNLRLPLISLIRGAAMRVPSGQVAAQAFDEPLLSSQELTCDKSGNLTPQGRALIDHDLVEATPLWFYILKESEARENGSRLGATGSHIVGETIYAAIKHDPDSYLNHPAATDMPPRWQIAGAERRIRSLSGLFELAPQLGN